MLSVPLSYAAPPAASAAYGQPPYNSMASQAPPPTQQLTNQMSGLSVGSYGKFQGPPGETWVPVQPPHLTSWFVKARVPCVAPLLSLWPSRTSRCPLLRLWLSLRCLLARRRPTCLLHRPTCRCRARRRPPWPVWGDPSPGRPLQAQVVSSSPVWELPVHRGTPNQQV